MRTIEGIPTIIVLTVVAISLSWWGISAEVKQEKAFQESIVYAEVIDKILEQRPPTYVKVGGILTPISSGERRILVVRYYLRGGETVIKRHFNVSIDEWSRAKVGSAYNP